QIEKAGPYAWRLTQLKEDAGPDATWPTLVPDLATARFVLAWIALHQASPPKPEEALSHLRRIPDLEARAHAGAAQAPAPRWRAGALEARALTLLADQARQAASTRDRAKDARDALEMLRSKMSLWLARVHAEKEEPVSSLPVALPPTVH